MEYCRTSDWCLIWPQSPTATSITNQTMYSEQPGDDGENEFRKAEKLIRKMGKELAAAETVHPAKRGKRINSTSGDCSLASTPYSAVAAAFPLVDVRSISDSNIDPRVQLVTPASIPSAPSDTPMACRSQTPQSPCPFHSLPYKECISVSPSARIYSISIQGVASGLYVIADALTPAAQKEWATIALETYSRANHTNLTNLARLAKLAEENKKIDKSVASCENKIESTTSEDKAQLKHDNGDDDDTIREDVWKSALRDGNNFTNSGFHRLRWSCLGYHYDWTQRKYEEDLLSPFPHELSDLCKNLAALVGQSIIPEAAIVNYYPQGSYMSGHIDDAELTMDEPIVSISLGRSAIFLLGGRTKQVTPVPILVHSGDVVIMSGESRFSYHGVPLIFPTGLYDSHVDGVTLNPPAESAMKTTVDPVDAYLKVSRINMNVRQVLKPNAKWLEKQGSGARTQTKG